MKFIPANCRIVAGMVCALALMAGAARAEDVRTAVRAGNEAMQAAVAKGDATALAALYAADGEVMPVGAAPVKGTDELHKFWAGILGSGIGSVTLKTLELYPAAGTATEIGEYSLNDKTGKPIDRGRYVVVWKKVGESWKLFRDIFASSAPITK